MKTKLFFLQIMLLFILNCSGDKIIEMKSWEQYYSKFSGRGCFLLYDTKNETKYCYNPTRCQEIFLPASTFKILNSLIALECGVIRDENEIIAWDGIDRGYKAWNQDLDLRGAIKYSAVWFYQELARRIGKEKMKNYVKLAEYGNMNIDGNLDSFWLDGQLRISAEEQLDFLRKLYNNELPFSDRIMNIVKDILLYEKGDKYKIKAKTGWTMRISPQIGWFVGWIEKDDDVFFFVNNLEITKRTDSKGRSEITKNILRELKIIP